MTIQLQLLEPYNGLMERISMEMSLKFSLLKETIHGKKVLEVPKGHSDRADQIQAEEEVN